VIQSFASKETEELFQYQHSRRFRAFERVALRKLLQLHAATELHVLASPPGNQLEALRRRPEGAALDTDQRTVANLFRVARRALL
jgi:toxin HigB-1